MSTPPPGSDRNAPPPSSQLRPSSPPPAAHEDRAELERHREELAARVAELHWDLGGLAYEMAIRDHFRNDVLLRRAAELQERDTELAEVERKLGEARAQGDGLGGEQARRAWARVLPPAQVSLLLLVAFLGFGAAVGAVAKGARSPRPRPREVLVAQAPAAAGGAVAPAQVSPPAVEPEATPSASEAESESTGEAASSAAGQDGSTSSAGKAGGSASGGGAGAAGGGAGAGGGGEGASAGKSGEAGSSSGSSKLPQVKHVFVVMLDDEPYATAFGPASPAHYLTGTLEHEGELLVRYYAVAHQQLANAIALLSGQGPTVQTAENCPTYEDLTPGTVGAEEQVSGNGCVYPSATQTLAGQLTAKHLTWKAYVEGMDEGGESGAGATGSTGSTEGACGHPALGAAGGGAPIPAQPPSAGQTYATWRNPFVYFGSVVDSPACASDDVGLNGLKSDLASAKTTPSFSYIVPDLCDDGNPTPCAPGQAAGMASAEGFLKKVVPEILGSKAYKANGLLVITTDEAPSSGEYADSSSCCGQPTFPNLPAPTGALGKPGGGQVGALLLSPFIKGGNLVQDQYNHFSLLRTVEDLFGLSHLGYAAGNGVSSFSPSLFMASK